MRAIHSAQLLVVCVTVSLGACGGGGGGGTQPPPQPDFALVLSTSAVDVSQGSAAPLSSFPSHCRTVSPMQCRYRSRIFLPA